MTNRLRESSLTEDALARHVIGLAMQVHRFLGCGFLESIYVNALEVELQEAGILFEREKRYSVDYKGVEIGYFHADLVIENRLVVEAKAVDALAVAHSVQLVNYLAVSKLELGVLLNFGPRSLEFKTKTRVYSSNLVPPNLQS